MKRSKNFMNFILSAGFLLTLSAPVMAAEESQVTPPEAHAEVFAPEVAALEEMNALLTEDTTPNIIALDPQAVTFSVESFDLDESHTMGSLDNGMSTQSIYGETYVFNDYLTSQYDQKYVQFGLAPGQIVNLTLQGPNNNNINYDLILVSVAADGSVTEVRRSSLGTFVDETTPETVAEGISYVHTGSGVGSYAAFVVSAGGSSTTESFELSVGLDVAGSYDANEPNETPLQAKTATSTTLGGSLHVANDQDWYVLSNVSGLQSITAGDYDVEVYTAVSGNQLKRVPENASGTYTLKDGYYYYVKVHSGGSDTRNAFAHGNYRSAVKDESVHGSFETAFDLGAWEYAYTKSIGAIPHGQTEVYYKFSIDSQDKAYIYNSLFGNKNVGMKVTVYDNKRNIIDIARVDFEKESDRGIITKSNGWEYLAVDIDGTDTNSIGYIKIEKDNSADTSGSFVAHINKRIYTGFGTFNYSGTVSNPGFDTSSIISLDLRNNSSIPNGAVVTSMDTYGTMSSSVGGVTHYLYAANSGELFESTYNSSSRGSFKSAASDEIEAKQVWGFLYRQTAFASTTMRNISMKLSWEYDISNTNYEPVY